MSADRGVSLDEEREVVAMVLEEARLLDERRFDDWLALFADDGLYWVPGQPGQDSPDEALSIFCERKPLLALRVNRLGRRDLHAQEPPTRTLHHAAAVQVWRSRDAGAHYEAHASLIVVEWREGDRRMHAGRTTHRLRRIGNALLIVQKRVDLIDCDAPRRAIAVPF